MLCLHGIPLAEIRVVIRLGSGRLVAQLLLLVLLPGDLLLEDLLLEGSLLADLLLMGFLPEFLHPVGLLLLGDPTQMVLLLGLAGRISSLPFQRLF